MPACIRARVHIERTLPAGAADVSADTWHAYRIRIHRRLLAAATVMRNGSRVLRAEYAGSCARLKNGRGLVAEQLGDARGGEHARAVAKGEHNYKFNALYRALPWPPLALVGRF